MPYLNLKLTLPQSDETTAKAAAVLTDLTARLLHKKRELTAIAVEYLPPSQWHIGGKPVPGQGRQTFFLEIKITAGTNTKDEKAAFVGAVFQALESLLGELDPASYTVIHEVSADAWGYAGATQERRYIAGKPL